jgi:uncharacterized protein (DUF305 family)
MIRHHAAGAAMAAYAATHAEHPRVREFAARMATVQRNEFNEMNHRRVAIGLPAVTRAELDRVERIHDTS